MLAASSVIPNIASRRDVKILKEWGAPEFDVVATACGERQQIFSIESDHPWIRGVSVGDQRHYWKAPKRMEAK